ncbi:MAG TPA: conjugative transposon protein TraK [Paludibacteraceae bacterium]|jgi:conjugative transposon TraK protein|nr:conjugative transposon protein TraK [Paludibacteraceae bacterium]HQJ89328.1 conjugative transposon protein TraK [Paludibacteraceae bacterium]
MANNDIPKCFTSVKIIMVILTVAITSFTIYICKNSFDSANSERDFIYVADANNTLLLALANDVDLNRSEEAKAHVKRFHELFFVLSPNAEFIENNMKKALYISDNSVKQVYVNLKEKKFFDSMIANGVSSEFRCDSINVAMEASHEFKVYLYGKTSLVYSDKIIYKTLKTSCFLSSCNRDEMNTNGFIIKNWKIEENNVLGQVNR